MSQERVPTLTAERTTVAIEAVKAAHGAPPWAATLVRTDDFLVTAICQAPGHPNDWHYHLSPECWSVYEGEIAWTLEGRAEPVVVQAGAWIMVPANTFHLIEVRGDQPAIRIAIVRPAEWHRHERADAPPAPAGARRVGPA